LFAVAITGGRETARRHRGVSPEIDGGRFAIKRAVGESVNVQAIVFADGHGSIACELLYRSADSLEWRRKPMAAKGNDCWEAEFPVDSLGRYFHLEQRWVDASTPGMLTFGSSVAESEDLLAAMRRYPDLSLATKFGRDFTVIGDREKARSLTWYAIFPRSTAMEPGRHGTFADCEKRLPYIL